MECSEPGLVRDEELLAYLAGERIRPVVEQHLARCSHCSIRLADFRRGECALFRKLYRWNCPPNQVLGEYQLEMLDAETALAVRLHVRNCAACTAELNQLEEFLSGEPLLTEVRLPAPALARNNHQIPSKSTAEGALKRLWDDAGSSARRVVATLLSPQPRLAYQRDVAPAGLWPRRYTAEGFTISLQVERESGRADIFQLIGFVTRKDTALESLLGMPVLLSSQLGTVVTQQVDELGNFVFSALIPQLYTLELQVSNKSILIEHIPVEVQEK